MRGARGAPWALRGPALIVAALALLPSAYLVLRALGAEDFLGLLLRERTLAVLGRSLLLATAVTLACTVSGPIFMRYGRPGSIGSADIHSSVASN